MQSFHWLCGLAACAALLAAGCGPESYEPPPTAPVSGTVTLDGQPMPEGEVFFMLPGDVPKVLPVKDGRFQGEAMVGTNRVEIRSYRMGEVPMMGDQPVGEATRENILPARYNTESQETAQVSDSGPNEFEFEVQSR